MLNTKNTPHWACWQFSAGGEERSDAQHKKHGQCRPGFSCWVKGTPKNNLQETCPYGRVSGLWRVQAEQWCIKHQRCNMVSHLWCALMSLQPLQVQKLWKQANLIDIFPIRTSIVEFAHDFLNGPSINVSCHSKSLYIRYPFLHESSNFEMTQFLRIEHVHLLILHWTWFALNVCTLLAFVKVHSSLVQYTQTQYVFLTVKLPIFRTIPRCSYYSIESTRFKLYRISVLLIIGWFHITFDSFSRVYIQFYLFICIVVKVKYWRLYSYIFISIFDNMCFSISDK